MEADAESRQMNARIEWTLAKHLSVKIQTRYYIPEVDLFASRLNHQVPMYVARRPDPGAMAIMRSPWTGANGHRSFTLR